MCSPIVLHAPLDINYQWFAMYGGFTNRYLRLSAVRPRTPSTLGRDPRIHTNWLVIPTPWVLCATQKIKIWRVG